MVFSSLTFLYIFLPLNIILYYILKGNNQRNILITIFSLFFYAWGEPIYVGLLIITAFIDYYNGLIIEKNKGNWKAKIAAIISIVINLSILMLFKYIDFIIENINYLGNFNIKYLKLVMPIGISFYTFQTISYTIDVYKGVVPAQKKYLNFLLFVSLFHQLVAGPIVRYADVANEIENRVAKISVISSGIFRFCIGLFKKVAIANIAAELAIPYLEGTIIELTTAEAWLGIVLFSIQIFFDFSGYSDMAIGLGRMFGFTYLENFNSPYAAKSITDFWRRWHISLGTFFKDYIYIPLGGNKANYYRNLFIVWLLTGAWHGASWNFIIWGLYFGIIIALEKLVINKLLGFLPNFLKHLYALIFIVLGWSIFYFTSFDRLVIYLEKMFWNTNTALYNNEVITKLTENSYWLFIALAGCLPIFDPANEVGKKFIKRIVPHISLQIIVSMLLLIVSTALLAGKSYNPFIYFRF